MSGEGAVPEKGARDIAIPKGCCNNKDFDMRALEGDDIRWSVPPWITEASGPVNEFLERRLNKERKILYNVMLSKERKTSEEHVICDNIYYLQELLKNNGVKEKKYDE